MRFLLCGSLGLLLSALTVRGADIFASDVTVAGIEAAVAAASHGDKIYLPPGTNTWGSTLRIGKNVHLLGTTNATKIYAGAGPVRMFRFDDTGFCRLSGIYFDGNNQGTFSSGWIGFSGSSGIGRIDNCTFTNFTQWTINQDNHNLLIDNCKFLKCEGGVNIHHSKWLGVGDFGDNSWAQPSTMGTTNALVIEDCIFDFIGTKLGSVAVDCNDGARWTFRHNFLTNGAVRVHGLDSGGRVRSGRHFEVYENYFEWVPVIVDGELIEVWTGIFEIRGGTGVIWNNVTTNFIGMLQPKTFREFTVFSGQPTFWTPWGRCTEGTNVWDGNLDSTGWPAIDQVGRGHGDYIQNSTPINATQGGAKIWPNQISEPIYVWGNVRNGVAFNGGEGTSSYATIQFGRDTKNGEAKPGYVPLAYPHPLRGESPAGPAGTIQYIYAGTNVFENAGTVTVTLTRIDGSSGTVTATNRTSSGPASEGIDYVGLTNAVTWTDGDTANKSFTVSILDNGAINSEPRWFSVDLIAVTGGAVSGNPNNFVVDIVDDDDDSQAPAITALAHSGVDNTLATITWTTDEQASTVVDYGTTTAFGQTVTNATLVTDHSIDLSSLNEATEYFYRARSFDAAGNQGISTVTNQFTTLSGAGFATYILDGDNPAAADAAGNDGSEAEPFMTLSYAVSRMSGGDTLLIKDNATNYSTAGSTIITGGPVGTLENKTTLKNFPGHYPWFVGTNSGRFALSITSNWWIEGLGFSNMSHNLTIRRESGFIVVTNCTFGHSLNQQVHVWSNSHNILIEGNTNLWGGFTGSQNGEAYYIGSHWTPGAVPDFTHGVTIRRNYISHMKSDGIELKHDVHDCVIEYNVLSDCVLEFSFGVRTIEVNETPNYPDNPNHIIRGNIIKDHPNNGNGSAIRLKSGALCYNNVIWYVAAPKPAIMIEDPEENGFLVGVWHNTIALSNALLTLTNKGAQNVSILNNIGPTTPGNIAYNSDFFADAVNKDFHLVAGAAPINAGSSEPLVYFSTDYDGAARVITPDMGAFEFLEAPADMPGGGLPGGAIGPLSVGVRHMIESSQDLAAWHPEFALEVVDLNAAPFRFYWRDGYGGPRFWRVVSPPGARLTIGLANEP